VARRHGDEKGDVVDRGRQGDGHCSRSVRPGNRGLSSRLGKKMNSLHYQLSHCCYLVDSNSDLLLRPHIPLCVPRLPLWDICTSDLVSPNPSSSCV